jgi:hypothetical protein
MGVPQEALNRAVTQAKLRESQGYFELARAGDRRAASLFVRLVADDLNPLGVPSGYGWLTKQPGETQVDGYAEDAICYGADPNDLLNVVDLVNGAGAPGASIGGSVKERRASNHWEAPKPLTQSELSYLLSGGMPTPVPPPTPAHPSYEAMGGDEGGKKVTRLMEADYKNAGKAGLDGDSGAWQWRTAYDFLSGICKTVEESIAKHQPEWRASLNAERASQGKPPIAW